MRAFINILNRVFYLICLVSFISCSSQQTPLAQIPLAKLNEKIHSLVKEASCTPSETSCSFSK